MTQITVNIASDSYAMTHFAADLFTRVVDESVSARGRFLVALSGGGTPLALYTLLAQSPYRNFLPWEKMHFFWGDERCVPPDDKESCYNQAWRTMLAHVPVPQANLHRAKGELSPREAAADYGRQLKAFAAPGLKYPRFDLVLLGLGGDGHTASLFPGSEVENRESVIAVTAQYQDRPASRISLTPQVFNAAHNAAFLAIGSEKAQAFFHTLVGEPDPHTFPAQRIQLEDGHLWWLVDKAAATLLPEKISGIEIQKDK